MTSLKYGPFLHLFQFVFYLTLTIFCLRMLVPDVCPLPAFFPRKLTLLSAYFTRKHILLIHEYGPDVPRRYSYPKIVLDSAAMSLYRNAHGTSAPASRPNRVKLVHYGADITSVNVTMNYGIAAENIRNFVIKTSLPNDKTGPFGRETGYSVQDRDFLERVKSLVLNNRTRKNIEILFEEYGLDYSFGRAEIMHVTELSRSSATELLTRLKLNGLIIAAEERNKYHFIV